MLFALVGWLMPQSTFGYTIQPHASNKTVTACNKQLCTWWHDNGEISTARMVQVGNVRQSRRYLVQVSIADASDYYDSFTYESIPRNGRGRIYSPWDPPDSDTLSDVDGISIEPSEGINMAWSQVEYSTDLDVKISTRDGSRLPGPSGVKVRPTSIPYCIRSSEDGGIIIRVPYDSNGRKFSVEFDNDLYTYRSDGLNYVSSGGTVVGIEPRNALVIFASAFLPDEMIPPVDGPDTKVMTPGPINQGD